jgi:hypothetical protein
MLEQYLNFDAKGSHTDFFIGLTEERLKELSVFFNEDVINEIESNRDYYTYIKENMGQLHAGRIIKFALSAAKNATEELAILFASPRIFENAASILHRKEQLKEILNNI